MADTFNDLFASVGKSTNSKIESSAEVNNVDVNNSIFTPKRFPTFEQFTFHSVECKQVEDIINAMPSNKAPGIDKLESLKTSCRLDSLLLHQSSMLLFHLQHSQGSGKQPKSHLFPNKAITNFLTITDQSRYYLRCQRSVRESLIISLSPI